MKLFTKYLLPGQLSRQPSQRVQQGMVRKVKRVIVMMQSKLHYSYILQGTKSQVKSSVAVSGMPYFDHTMQIPLQQRAE